MQAKMASMSVENIDAMQYPEQGVATEIIINYNYKYDFSQPTFISPGRQTVVNYCSIVNVETFLKSKCGIPLLCGFEPTGVTLKHAGVALDEAVGDEEDPGAVVGAEEAAGDEQGDGGHHHHRHRVHDQVGGQ